MSPRDLLKYLGEQAAALAKTRNEPIDRVRKKNAFDFLLRRLTHRAPGEYVLKGGYAIELKCQVIRATKDLDIVSQRLASTIAGGDLDLAAAALRQKLVDALAEPSGEDDRYVSFRLAEGVKIIAGGGGGIQFPVRMLVDRQRFTEFSVDLSVEDIENASNEALPLTPIVDGFDDSADGRVLTDEHIFAEKLHAYMRHCSEHQARVKDFADLVLLAQREMNFVECKRLAVEVFDFWLNKVGKRRVLSLPQVPSSIDDLKPPPSEWRAAYEHMARDMRIDADLGRAFLAVRRCVAAMIAADLPT